MTKIRLKTLTDLIRLFNERDLDRSGKLDPKELAHVEASTFETMDADGDELVSPPELAAGRLSHSIVARLSKAQDMGRAFPTLLLKRNTEIGGVTYEAHHELKFHPNGQVNFGILAEETVDPKDSTIHYKGETAISFYPSGQVHYATLANDTSIGGIVYQAGTSILFFENGRVKNGVVSKGSVHSIAIPSGSKIGFKRDGSADALELGADAKVRGLAFKAGSKLFLRRNGSLVKAKPSHDIATPRGKFKGGTWITFYDTGEIREGTTIEAPRGGPLAFAAGRTRFGRNGKVYGGVLQHQKYIQDLDLPAGTFVVPDPANAEKLMYVEFTSQVRQGGKHDHLRIDCEPGMGFHFHKGYLVQVDLPKTLPANYRFLDIPYRRGTSIIMDPKTNINIPWWGSFKGMTGILATDYNGFKKGTELEAHSNRYLIHRGTISESEHYGGPYKPGSEVFLYRGYDTSLMYPILATLRSGEKALYAQNGECIKGVSTEHIISASVNEYYETPDENYRREIRHAILKLSFDANPTIDGIKYRGKELLINEDGDVLSGKLAEEAVIGNAYYAVGTRVERDTEGKLTSIFLTADTRIPRDGHLYKAGTKVTFFQGGEVDGMVDTGILAERTRIHGYDIPAGAEVSYHRSSRANVLKEITTKKPMQIKPFNGELVVDTTHMEFHAYGNNTPSNIHVSNFNLPIAAIIDEIPVPIEFIIGLLSDKQKVETRKGEWITKTTHRQLAELAIKNPSITGDFSISFYSDDKVRSITTLSPVLIDKDGTHLRAHETIQLWSKGIPRYDDIVSIVDRELARANP